MKWACHNCNFQCFCHFCCCYHFFCCLCLDLFFNVSGHTLSLFLLRLPSGLMTGTDVLQQQVHTTCNNKRMCAVAVVAFATLSTLLLLPLLMPHPSLAVNDAWTPRHLDTVSTLLLLLPLLTLVPCPASAVDDTWRRRLTSITSTRPRFH